MRRTVSICLVLAGLGLAGCGGGGDKETGPPPGAPLTIRLTSEAFPAGGAIPRSFTCSGRGLSPPLRWDVIPGGTRSYALLVTDPDAPGGTFVHWTAWDLPQLSTGLPAGARPPAQGENSSGKTGWTPPCPPGGKPHRYVFMLFALSGPLGLNSGAKPADVEQAIRKRALAEGRLTGTFGR